jgi:hypothetical protein
MFTEGQQRRPEHRSYNFVMAKLLKIILIPALALAQVKSPALDREQRLVTAKPLPLP